MKSPGRLAGVFTLWGMNLYKFRLLIPRAQLLTTMTLSIYLAYRWDEKGPVTLYFLVGKGKGVFVELQYIAGRGEIEVVRSQVSVVP